MSDRVLWSMLAGSAALPLLAVLWRDLFVACVLGVVFLAALVGCVWLAHRWTVSPPMTDYAELTEDEALLVERARRAVEAGKR